MKLADLRLALPVGASGLAGKHLAKTFHRLLLGILKFEVHRLR